ncbi:SDR family NAD(P)-dependent oxidoreductase [Paenibacillus bovis]|uniref:Short-chain dehydrogenase n=1 Tax=Paenibacillus bovis TaxID=1616788 RepID=A0A172ZBE7_9BACL|nr:SDR family NAD(P)-dependent oxidoreductase [Paenibacillus bovis]ANF94823.1 short-chain dehydrogenase [Paenibacillus bovis]
MKKTIAIVGAGAGLGLSIARKFGQNGFRVALISRDQTKLDELAAQLAAENIEAVGFAADVFYKEQLEAALQAIKKRFGFIDVVEYSPTAGNYLPTPAWQITDENALDIFSGFTLGAIRTVQSVLPDMLTKGTGALLFTTALTSIYSIQSTANMGIAMSALRNYAHNLHKDLADKGIYVGHLALGVYIKPGTQTDASYIADAWFDLYSKQNKMEETFPVGVTPESVIR